MAEVQHHKAGEAAVTDLFPKGKLEFVHGSTMTMAVWEFEPDAVVAEHVHPHEQIIHCREGLFEVMVGGELVLLGPGDVVVVPGDVEHSARARTAAKGVDVFHPVRDDYRF